MSEYLRHRANGGQVKRLARLCAAALAWAVLSRCALAQEAGHETGEIGKVPSGLTPLLAKSSTRGWHWSRSVHHGTTAQATVTHGELVLSPRSFGQGGLLLTDKSYRDFDLYLEARPDTNYNSGVFLRSTEAGSAYQIELIRPGDTGAFLGEGIRLSRPKYLDVGPEIDAVWKEGEWNSMRVRMEGESPHVTLWINGVKMWEIQMPQNDQVAGR